jgi:hypothetical protein
VIPRVTYFQMGRASFDTIDFWILNKEYKCWILKLDNFKIQHYFY